LDNENLGPSVEQEDTGNYKEDKVSAHCGQVFGNSAVAAVRAVA
jgi:hypothetical protein